MWVFFPHYNYSGNVTSSVCSNAAISISDFRFMHVVQSQDLPVSRPTERSVVGGGSGGKDHVLNLYIIHANFRRRAAPLRIPKDIGRWVIVVSCYLADYTCTGRCETIGFKCSWPEKYAKTNTWRSVSAAVNRGEREKRRFTITQCQRV